MVEVQHGVEVGADVVRSVLGPGGVADRAEHAAASFRQALAASLSERSDAVATTT